MHAIFKKFFIFLSLAILYSCLISPTAFAKKKVNVDDYAQQQINFISQYLQALKNHNQIAKQQYEQLRKKFEAQKSQTEIVDVSKQQLDLVSVNYSLARTELVRLSQALVDAERESKATQQLIARLEERHQEMRLSSQNLERDKAEFEKLEQNIIQQKKLYKLQNEKIKELQKSYDYELRRTKLLEEMQQNFTKLYAKHQQYLRDVTFQKLAEHAQQEQAVWFKQLADYNKKLEKIVAGTEFSSPTAISIRLRIFELYERVKLSQLTVGLAKLEMAISDLLLLSNKGISFPQLNARLTSLLNDTRIMKNDIDSRLALIKEHKIIQQQSVKEKLISAEQTDFYQRLLDDLSKQYQQKLQLLQQYDKKLINYQSELQQKLVQLTTERHGLPGFDVDEWMSLGRNILDLVGKTTKYLQSLQELIVVALSQLSLLNQIFLVVVELLWLIGWFIVRRYSKAISRAVEGKRQILSANIVYLLMQLLRRNLIGLILFGAGVSLILFCGLSFKYYAAILYLISVWFAFRFILEVAHLILLEHTANISGSDVQLYHRLKWTFIPGAIITAFTVIAEQLRATPEVMELANRLFMLFLLMVSLVLLRSYKVIPSLIEPYIETRLYLKKAIRLISLLVPLTLFSIAVIGVCGYVELAWTMSYYQLGFVLVLTLYVVARGLLIDLMNLSVRLMIHFFKNGWLWSEVILKPIDRICRVALFFSAWFLLFWFYGWWQNSILINQLDQLLKQQIFAFTGGHITLLSTVHFLILVSVFFWVTSWTREFAYRWLFSSVKDPGVRNSFSIFSQYAIFTIGAVITLRVLGIDFTGMAVILGGLAVGLGFGLRDVTSNIISGIVLLIERPVRVGDTVAIGNFEGEVIDIGIRAMTVRSWDHMDVVVPNAEVFNKSFTNWTHQDSIVRSVVSIKIQRQDDPAQVRDLITQVLNQNVDVLKNPAAEVFIKEIDASLIEFEVRYFVNLQKCSRVEVRSRVLFAICQIFKDHQILPPNPQQDIHIKNVVS